MKPTINFQLTDITQYTGGEHKPWWIACTKGDLSKFHGFNSGTIGGLIDEAMDELVKEGKILHGKHYAVNVRVEISEYKD